MKTVSIAASRTYDILIERGGLDRLGEWAAGAVGICAAMVIADDTVDALYGERAVKSLQEAGFAVSRFVFPHGEKSKNLDVYARALNALCEKRFTRKDIVVALGGGVVGDLAGFAAATYQRGIRFVQVPTTLLAMVDSSVGGKTAVDLPIGKNQVGAFHQPSLVVCDPDLLQTLPNEQYLCGCAETLKYGVLADAEFFDSMAKTPICEQYEAAIERSVMMKRDFVMADEFDVGKRRMLNLGHSFGHAVEACSNFTVLHGQAVAAGLAVMMRAAVKKGYCKAESAERVIAVLRSYGLPTEILTPLDDMVAALASDKKLLGKQMNLIVPAAIGDCRIVPVPAEELSDWMRAGGVR